MRKAIVLVALLMGGLSLVATAPTDAFAGARKECKQAAKQLPKGAERKAYKKQCHQMAKAAKKGTVVR